LFLFQKTAEAESLLSAQASSVLVRMSVVGQSRRPDRALITSGIPRWADISAEVMWFHLNQKFSGFATLTPDCSEANGDLRVQAPRYRRPQGSRSA